MIEIWSSIIDKNLYISNYGRVYNKKKKKMLKIHRDRYGYCYVSYRKKNYWVHRLVALAYIPNTDNKPEVNHLDCIRHHNEWYNLEWVTGKENMEYCKKCNHTLTGVKNPANKYSEEDIHNVCKLLEDGFSSKYIASHTSVTYRTIIHIRRGDTWSEISSQYKIPTNTSYDETLKDDIRELILNGYKPSEIIDKLGLPNKKKFKSLIWSIQDKIKLEVQRLSEKV